ncbi:chromosome segregation ATPase-like protein [Paracoccus hibiscisoli]|uniref:Chromosome segregation ATPase-like protein n=1 Tax=Paracoccus hibiscisoli TaxID=2023261 RepID=A0A4U0QE90_9RHOB|nr:chromosome segregation ATPase-like protein [Paracoccus hibiscisoli]TJZ79801.1 chromosome segregation ATPase-like protein [Paracoccus hibiscisoli]
MLTGSPILVLFVAGALAFLTVLHFWLATRYDHGRSIQGPLEEERAIFARITEKRATLADIEHDLQKRREALAVVADVQAEVDALTRKRDDLLDEWNQMEPRRQEVLALRRELEEVQVEKLRFDGEFAAAKAEHEEIRDRLARAERLLDQIESLKKEREELANRIEQLKPELRLLEEAKERVAHLDGRAIALEADVARLQGQIDAGQDRVDELDTRIAASRNAAAEVENARTKALADLSAVELALRGAEAQSRDAEERMRRNQAGLDRIKADLDASRLELTDLQDQVGELTSHVNELQEQKAVLAAERSNAVFSLDDMRREIDRLEETRAMLEARNAKLSRQSGEAGTSDDDPLRELKVEPQLITVLRNWEESEAIDENDALQRVQGHFRATGLTYSDRKLRAFHTAMKVNESTQMAVLAGISGTGKSQLPRQYAAGMGIGFLQVPVQPRWDSPQDLMGFYNYVEGRFRPTDMARALWAMDELNNPEGALHDRMLMILLDEMNLARVEYYFSDFLSRLESRPAAFEVGEGSRRKDAEIELEIPTPDGKSPRIFPGYNLLFAGTMNEDESTQSLSDKVVDRANVIRFAAPRKIDSGAAGRERPADVALKRSTWQRWAQPRRADHERKDAASKIEQMAEMMKDIGRPFGHRLGRAMLSYVDLYPRTQGIPDIVNHALADQVEMRLLPKLRGIEVEAKRQELDELEAFVSGLGDTELATAISKSVAAAETTGQFVWLGVGRE